MTGHDGPEGDPAGFERAAERRVLYEIIRSVGSPGPLGGVLRSVVNLIVEGVSAQSGFVWIVGDDHRLHLRAASDAYAGQIGRASLEPGEGFAGWVLERGLPIFIPEDALADPRARYFPEFDEEKYQSMVSVPLFGRDDAVFGVIGIHSLAPRTLSAEDAAFVVHAASLAAGAIDNARLYELARRRVTSLEGLGEIGDLASRAGSLDELLPPITAAARRLLEAAEVHVYERESGGGLRRCASAPDSLKAPARLPRASGPGHADALWGEEAIALALPLLADGEEVGQLLLRRDDRPFGPDELDLAAAIAAQAAIGIKKVRLIEGLTERNLLKDMLADLRDGRLDEVAARARRLGLDLARPHVALVAVPWHPQGRADTERLAAVERFEAAAAAVLPGVALARRGDRTEGIVPIAARSVADVAATIGAVLGGEIPLLVGLSEPCLGAEQTVLGLAEAADAARAAPLLEEGPAAVAFDALGPLKYLLRIPPAALVRDRHIEAVRRLLDYDRQRRSSLVPTLEELLARRGNVVATARALWVHPNTLRQRIGRIRDVCGIDLRTEDWLTVQVALKIALLRSALDEGGE